MESSKTSQIINIRSLNRFDQKKDKLKKPMGILKNIIEELKNNKYKIPTIEQALKYEKNKSIIIEIKSDLKEIETYTKALNDLKLDIIHNIDNKQEEVNIDISDIDESFLKYAYKINLEGNIKYLSMKPIFIDGIKVSGYININNDFFTIVDGKILSLVLSEDSKVIKTLENTQLRLNYKDPTIVEKIETSKKVKKSKINKNKEQDDVNTSERQIQEFKERATHIDSLIEKFNKKNNNIDDISNEIDELFQDLKDDPDYAEVLSENYYSEEDEKAAELPLNSDGSINFDKLSQELDSIMGNIQNLSNKPRN